MGHSGNSNKLSYPYVYKNLLQIIQRMLVVKSIHRANIDEISSMFDALINSQSLLSSNNSNNYHKKTNCNELNTDEINTTTNTLSSSSTLNNSSYYCNNDNNGNKPMPNDIS